MACMEVWGGTSAVDEAVTMTGLDAWVYSKPYQDAAGGGDVHYVSSCATGRITRLLVADVSGHGEAVGEVAAGLRDLLRRYVNYIDQRRFFRAMNRRFADLHADGLFATAVVTTYFAPTRTLSVSNAGHPPPLIWRAASKSWDFLQPGEATVFAESSVDRASASVDEAAGEGGGDDEPTNLPLGVIDAARYDRFDVTLAPGDCVLCYTDSLSEARGTDGELLSMAGLLDAMSAVDATDPKAVVPATLAAVGALHPGNLDGDDLTLLLFTPNAAPKYGATRDRLLAPLKVARSLLRSMAPGGEPAALPEFTVANLGGSLLPPLSRAWTAGKPTRAATPATTR